MPFVENASKRSNVPCMSNTMSTHKFCMCGVRRSIHHHINFRLHAHVSKPPGFYCMYPPSAAAGSANWSEGMPYLSCKRGDKMAIKNSKFWLENEHMKHLEFNAHRYDQRLALRMKVSRVNCKSKEEQNFGSAALACQPTKIQDAVCEHEGVPQTMVQTVCEEVEAQYRPPSLRWANCKVLKDLFMLSIIPLQATAITLFQGLDVFL